MISSSYETVRDDFFTFNKHRFYYYDVNKNEFVPNNKLNKIEEVKEFEKPHRRFKSKRESNQHLNPVHSPWIVMYNSSYHK